VTHHTTQSSDGPSDGPVAPSPRDISSRHVGVMEKGSKASLAPGHPVIARSADSEPRGALPRTVRCTRAHAIQMDRAPRSQNALAAPWDRCELMGLVTSAAVALAASQVPIMLLSLLLGPLISARCGRRCSPSFIQR
jgi:hypothetical protein